MVIVKGKYHDYLHHSLPIFCMQNLKCVISHTVVQKTSRKRWWAKHTALERSSSPPLSAVLWVVRGSCSIVLIHNRPFPITLSHPITQRLSFLTWLHTSHMEMCFCFFQFCEQTDMHHFKHVLQTTQNLLHIRYQLIVIVISTIFACRIPFCLPSKLLTWLKINIPLIYAAVHTLPHHTVLFYVIFFF